jgi:multidrug efflux pump subunit AcrA (membrane-fusion protein)
MAHIITTFCLIIFSMNAAFSAVTVFVEVMKEKEVFDSYHYPAKIIPKVHSNVLSESQGVVDKLNFQLGQEVKKDQVIAKVRHTDPVYQYRPVELRAPVSGVISRVHVTEGSTVSLGETLISITDPKQAKILIEISGNDLSALKVGLEGNLHLREINKNYNVKIIGMSPLVDSATGTASAELEIVGDENIPLGTIGRVTFKTNMHKGILISHDALIYKGRDTYVHLVVEDNKIKSVPVKLGMKRSGMIEILEGLKVGEKLVTRSSKHIKTGDDVVVANDVK